MPVNESTNSCIVCSKLKSSYKCPKCRTVYCSLQCNKVHKLVCPSVSRKAHKEIQIGEGKPAVTTDNLTALPALADQQDLSLTNHDVADESKIVVVESSDSPTATCVSESVEVSPAVSTEQLSILLSSTDEIEAIITAKGEEINVQKNEEVISSVIDHIEMEEQHSSSERMSDTSITVNNTSDTSDNKIPSTEAMTTENLIDPDCELLPCVDDSEAIVDSEEAQNTASSSSSSVPTSSGVDRNIGSNEMTILSSKTVQSLLQSDWLRKMLKSSRLRDDILSVDSAPNRQAALKKIRLQKPDLDEFLVSLLVDVVQPSLD